MGTLDDLGQAYLKVEDARSFVRLVEEYEYFPACRPGSSEDLTFLGNVKLRLNRPGEALDFFKRAADGRTENAYLVYKMGRSLVEMGNAGTALERFRQAVQLDPDFADAHYRAGACLELIGDSASALTSYQKAVSVLPNHLEGILAVERLSP